MSQNKQSYKNILQDLFVIGIFVMICFLVYFSVRDPAQENSREVMRQHLQEMSPEEKEMLRRKKEQFGKLKDEEKQRLRDLHAAIDKHENKEELNRVMQQYYQWLKTLSPGEHTDLLQLKGDDLIAKIQQLKKTQREKEFRRNYYSEKRKDIKKVALWLEKYLADHREEILESIVKRKTEDKKYRQKFAKYSKEHQNRELFKYKFGSIFSRRNSRPLKVSDEDFKQLINSLSSTAQQEYNKIESESERKRKIHRWIAAAGYYHYVRPTAASDEKLKEFMDKLPTDEQHKLHAMSHDQMLSRLRELYSRSHHSRHPFYNRSRRPNESRRPRPDGRKNKPEHRVPQENAPQPQ